ncbi:MAG: gliding motility-associated C-terminal domain-containing protein [bacterium]
MRLTAKTTTNSLVSVIFIAALTFIGWVTPAFGDTILHNLYSDSGIIQDSEVFVWENDNNSADDFAEVSDASAPEGDKVFQFNVNSAWGGWGIFFKNSTIDLSGAASGNLVFWVKTPVKLKIEMQETGVSGAKSAVYLNSYGWNGTNTWQEITIPLQDFLNKPLNSTAIYSPFMITVEQTASFSIDHVRITDVGDPVDPPVDPPVEPPVEPPVDTLTPVLPYNLYSDDGIPQDSEVYVWEADGDSLGDFAEVSDPSAPEGDKVHRFNVDSAWGGWGLFFLDKKLNLSESASGNLVFWVKTPVKLKIEMQENGASGTKSAVYLDSYGWDGTDNWQEITIPLQDFLNKPLDATTIYSPFMISVEQTASFSIDHVRITDGSDTVDPPVDPVDPVDPVVPIIPPIIPESGQSFLYNIYTDNGIPQGSDVFVWEADGDSSGDFAEVSDPSAPEGNKVHRFNVDSAWGGWGVFYATDPDNQTVDFSSYVTGNLIFWIKTPVKLKIEMQETGASGTKSTVYLDSYDWDGTNTWQEIKIPLQDFLNKPLDATAIYSPFMISAEQTAEFSVDYVRIVSPPVHDGATKVEIQDNKFFVNGQPFKVKGVNTNFTPVGKNPLYYDWTVDKRNYEIDIELLKAIGANVVRIYNIPSNQEALLKFYEQGIYMILTFPVGEDDINNKPDMIYRYLSFVSDWMNHPAVLAWCIGNEVDYWYGYNDAQKAEWFSLLNECAKQSHLFETSAGITPHPVTTANSGIEEIGVHALKSDDVNMPNLDFWSIQTYRGSGFGNLFDDYKSRSSKPLLISEFGCDAWDGTKGVEDQLTQNQFIASQWNEIAAQVSSDTNPGGICMGGILFQWRDGWFKYEPGALDEHNTEQSWMNYYYPDPYMNEEWWGIIGINAVDPTSRDLREAFYTLMGTDYWRDEPFTKKPKVTLNYWIAGSDTKLTADFEGIFSKVRSRFNPIPISQDSVQTEGVIFNQLIIGASVVDGGSINTGEVAIPRYELVPPAGVDKPGISYFIEVTDEFNRKTYFGKSGEQKTYPEFAEMIFIPISLSLTKTVSSSGGTLIFPDGSTKDGEITFIIPEGAVDGNVEIMVEMLDPTSLHKGPSFAKSEYPIMAYRLSPKGLKFKKPITVSLLYFDGDQPLAQKHPVEPVAYNEEQYGVLLLNESKNEWQLLERNEITVDKENNLVTFQTDHFSIFGVFPLGDITTLTSVSYKPTQKIITPNGDGYNDFLLFNNLEGKGVEIKIFNIAGKKIRSINHEPYQWDGKDDDGNFAEIGVYIYQFKVEGKRINGMIGVAR